MIILKICRTCNKYKIKKYNETAKSKRLKKYIEDNDLICHC